jgi:hypothetical protein
MTDHGESKMRIRRQDRTEDEIDVTDEEFLALVHNSFRRLRGRSSIVECVTCGRRILVNNSDFHQVRLCDDHRA